MDDVLWEMLEHSVIDLYVYVYMRAPFIPANMVAFVLIIFLFFERFNVYRLIHLPPPSPPRPPTPTQLHVLFFRFLSSLLITPCPVSAAIEHVDL